MATIWFLDKKETSNISRRQTDLNNYRLLKKVISYIFEAVGSNLFSSSEHYSFMGHAELAAVCSFSVPLNSTIELMQPVHPVSTLY
jgi:hypothetical protein